MVEHQLRRQLGRANDSKQSATWEATQAFKLFWSSIFIFFKFARFDFSFFFLILMYLCCSVSRFQGCYD